MATRTIPTLLFALSLAFAADAVPAYGQESKPTVRHHRVAEPADEDPNAALLDQAETAMQKNAFVVAEAALQKILAAKPDDYRAWFDLGYVYNATQRKPEAINAYRRSVTAKPDVFESNLNLGLLLAKQGDTAGAAQFLKIATQLRPSTNPDEGLSRAWQALGMVEDSADPQLALVAYGTAAKLAPKDLQPHLSAGSLLARQNKLEEAAGEYQAALAIDGASTEALSGLVNVLITQKKHSEAETALHKLLTANPENGPARVQMARLLAAQGKNEEAVQQLQGSAQADTGDPQLAMELGQIYLKAGKDAEAEQQFRVAVQKMPRNADAHYSLGLLLMHEKKFEESQKELLIAINLKPDMVEAYGNLAVVAASNKNYVLTMRALDVRAKYLPEMPATYFLRATTYDNLKVIPKAVEYYQQFLAVDDGKFPDQEWQARHRLIALDPKHADKYRIKVPK
jgi:tetratricopeptide (TPR) repeat protein